MPRKPQYGQLPVKAEKDWQDTVMRAARLTGWLGYHVYDSRRSSAGFPDCVFLREERMVVAELKTETGRLTADQKKWLTAFAAAGAEVYLWRPSDWRQVEKVLKRGRMKKE